MPGESPKETTESSFNNAASLCQVVQAQEIVDGIGAHDDREIVYESFLLRKANFSNESHSRADFIPGPFAILKYRTASRK